MATTSEGQLIQCYDRQCGQCVNCERKNGRNDSK